MGHVPALKRLEIKYCDELTYFYGDECTHLKRLEIYSCGKLSCTITCMELEELVAHMCKEVIFGQGDFCSLERLSIDTCQKLRSLPGGLRSCTSLNISYCMELTSVPDELGEWCSLVEFRIRQCPSLSYFPEESLGSLTQLKRLGIGGFWEELEAFPAALNSIQRLSLEELWITGWDKLKSLPHQLQCLTTLKGLSIYDFDGVEALPDWLGDLSSLQKLAIFRCKNLESLPTSRAMQRLSKLTELVIDRCPYLKQNCTKDWGSEWSKISHIPQIEIDRQR